MNTTSIAAISDIQSNIQAIEGDMGLYEETNFNSRANAIDFIDFHILDRMEGLLQDTEIKEKADILKQRAEKLKFRLEKTDINLFRHFREKIKAGIYTRSLFMKMISKYMGYNVHDINHTDKIGYENLDVFINGLLSDQAVPEATKDKAPEMVFYQKTPARVIFEMARRAELKKDDIFFDLGSGLGQVTILMNMISGAITRGIEYEPSYYNYAKECALQLNLSGVEFINADAREGDYSQGTVFFMYTPFEGYMLQNMMEILRKESEMRTIKIFTYGPCSPFVAKQHWLYCADSDTDNPYKLYEFISLNNPSAI